MSEDPDHHGFGDGLLRATVAADGAELRSLDDARFGPLMWNAGAAWPRVSPVLFPIVGRLNGDRLREGGREHRLTQHGFARDRRFRWLERTDATCRLVLEDDAATREAFPHAFRLELAYAVADGALGVRHLLSNPGTATLPASLGAHPAFRWPLSPAVPADLHRLEFAQDQPDPVRRLEDGLLDPRPRASPVRGATLALDRALFAQDALIFDRPRGTSVRYRAPGALALEIAWTGFRELGVWSKPDAGDFLCVEPWRGHADPAGFTGEFTDKPGVMHLAPGETRELSWTVRAVADPG